MLEDKSVEEHIQEGGVVLGSEPIPDMSVTEMRDIISSIITVQEWVDVYAAVHNKFGYVEDEEYDYEEGTDEYERACSVTDAYSSNKSNILWGNMVISMDVVGG